MNIHTKSVLIITAVTLVSSALLWAFTGFSTTISNFDGPYYAVIAQCGYVKSCISHLFSFPLPLEYYAAHLPLYPLFIRIVSLLSPLNLLQSSVLLSLLFSIVYSLTMYLIWQRMGWKNGLGVALVSLFFWPRMWVVRSVGSPETLFLGLIVLSLYLFEKKKFLWAGLFGALATLTKTPGVLLFAGYALYLAQQFLEHRKIDVRSFWIILIPLALIGLFGFHYLQTGDFLAYFNSGDNIHLQVFPFRVFDSNQPWVGTFWLEDVLWIYLVGGLGAVAAMRKSRVWGWFGIVFFLTILFVSHRDISRYSLPLVPVVLLGFSELLARREVKIALALLVVPMFFYSINFMNHNAVGISDLAPFFLK